MLGKIGGYVLPEWIKDELHAFSPSELCSRNEIRIAGNEDDDVSLALQRDRGDIQTDTHVDALLPQGRREVIISEVVG